MTLDQRREVLAMVRVNGLLLGLTVLSTACTGTIGGGGANGDGQGDGDDNGTAGNGSGGSGQAPLNTPPGAMRSGARFARLTHFQWRNSVRDLLRLSSLPTPAAVLKDDAVLGFDNNNAGTALDVSFDLRSDYERAAESFAQSVTKDDAAIARLVPANAPKELEPKARAVIRSLAERGYRRAVQQSEVDELWALFKEAPSMVSNPDAFKAGLEVLIGVLLQSPEFLYRIEVGSGNNKGGFDLTPFELASRLAFALTDTIPDDELLEAARGNRLSTDAQIKAQAERLLKTDAAAASATHFHEQLFRLASFDKIDKDASAFPDFGDDMPAILKEEARLFLNDIVQANKPAKAILTSSETFVNSKLASIYGLSGNFDASFRKATLDAKQRKGILSHIGFLAANAGAKDPDPIHRGVFISNVVLCKSIPLPNVMPTPDPNAMGRTNRERVEARTGKGTCGAPCHATLINPLGYAFESFDAIGRQRSLDNGVAVDTKAEYTGLDDGTITVNNGLELSEKLADSPDFHSCYLSNWLQYLWSRSKLPEDDDALSDLIKESRDGKSVKEMLLSFVVKPWFRRYVP